MGAVDTEPGTRRVPRRAWSAAAGVAVVAALVSVWQVTAPDDLTGPGATMSMTVEPGGSAYVGYYPLSERDLVIESIEPVTLNGLHVTLWLCHPVSDEDPLGSAAADDLDEFCRSVEPFAPGTRLAGRHPDWRPTEPYLLAQVTATSDRPQGLCGLDITYRRVDGWRTGRHPETGSQRVVLNEEPDTDWPDEELLSACESG
jgi:hypothetical protein